MTRLARLKSSPFLGPALTRAVRVWRASHAGSDWTSAVDLSLWDGIVNSSEAETTAQIHQKIAQFRQSGAVTVVGGTTTAGDDRLFAGPSETGPQRLAAILQDIPAGEYLLLYPPHPFWTQLYGSTCRWIPSWEDLYWQIYHTPGWQIVQFSPSFDAAGRYFLVAQKAERPSPLLPLADLAGREFHVFYMRSGGDARLSRSNEALSAHLCLALARTGARVTAHDIQDTGTLRSIKPGSVLVGHVGPWVKPAYDQGLKDIVLYNPVNRWYPTRNNPYYESTATIEEQVRLAKLVIAQSGAIWRNTQDYPDPAKWRWIDLGVDRSLFPLVKSSFAPPGKRQFLFFHLYDAQQKGADIAAAVTQARPQNDFVWLSGATTPGARGRRLPSMSNTSARFRRAVTQCDFALFPSREDAQPGALVEVAALGVLPAACYSTGFSISVPGLVEPNEPASWLSVVDQLQAAPDAVLRQAQAAMQHYLECMHNWTYIEQSILFYLREANL